MTMLAFLSNGSIADDVCIAMLVPLIMLMSHADRARITAGAGGTAV